MAFKSSEKSRIALSPGERRALLTLAALLLLGLLAGQIRRYMDRDTSVVRVEGLQQLVPDTSQTGSSEIPNASTSVAIQGSEGVISTPEDVGGGTGVETGKASTSALPHKVDINQASIEELESLPGIGPVMAERIVEWRRIHGSFQRLEDLKLVKGIGDKTFRRISPLVTVTP
ncbi:MAG: helix-hairpin-helix domain-containing protein [bacterium]